MKEVNQVIAKNDLARQYGEHDKVRPLPDWYQPERYTQIEVDPFQEWFLERFDFLSTTRAQGPNGPAQMDGLKALDYLVNYRLIEVNRAEKYVRMLLRMDAEWMRFTYRNHGKAAKQPGPEAASQPVKGTQRLRQPRPRLG